MCGLDASVLIRRSSGAAPLRHSRPSAMGTVDSIYWYRCENATRLVFRHTVLPSRAILTIRREPHSNMIAAGQYVLTDAQVQRLTSALDYVHQRFASADQDPGSSWYAMDIEFSGGCNIVEAPCCVCWPPAAPASLPSRRLFQCTLRALRAAAMPARHCNLNLDLFRSTFCRQRVEEFLDPGFFASNAHIVESTLYALPKVAIPL